MHLAAGRGYLSVAEALVKCKADINTYSKNEYEGATPLHRAATQGHPEMVAFLLSKGAEVDARDAAGMTALTRAAMHGYTEVLNKLLDASAKPDIEDEAGLTALAYAATRGHLDSVKTLLVRAKADPNAGKAGAPLFWAVSKSECLKLLLEAGAKPNIKRDGGQTPLLIAAEKSDYESALLLIMHGADVNLANDDRMTPLQMAVWSESIPIVSLLLTNHAEVNAIGPARRNALIMAQEAEAGSRPFKPGDYGGSGREANKLIARKIAALLREHGAQDQVTNKP
jgi:cytohesin